MYRQQAEPHEPLVRAARIACLVTYIVHITREHSESHKHEHESCGRALRGQYNSSILVCPASVLAISLSLHIPQYIKLYILSLLLRESKNKLL
jgi:hypothetical protein